MATVNKGQILRSDLNNWDGITKTASRIDSSGGTTTGVTIGDAVDVLQVYGSGTDYTLATITAAKSAVGSNNVSFIFATGTWTITDDLTLPSNITCIVPAGCVFNVSASKTLTFSGFVHRENDTWTSGSGTITTTKGSYGLISDTTDTGTGDALIGVKRTATGGQETTLHAWHEYQVINAFEFMTAAQIADVQAKTRGEDVTAAIQAAIDALPTDGGFVKCPLGYYETSSALINNGKLFVGLIGEGWTHQNNNIFGNAGWTTNPIDGTVIFQSTATENGFTYTDSPVTKILFQDIAFQGPGSGTTIGISLVGLGTRAIFRNVAVANFATGVKYNDMYDCSAYDLDVRGCTTGVSFVTSNNQNVFYNLKTEYCDTGVSIADAALITFYGGLSQNIITDGIVITDSSNILIDGVWFENSAVTGADIRIETTGATTDNEIRNCRISSEAGAGIDINGGQNLLLKKNRIITGTLDIAVAATKTILIQNNLSGATFNNNSVSTTIITDGQITFPTTQQSSSDVNTLDDYEEGTWTPVLSDGTNNATSGVAVGTYTKIGRLVVASGRLQLTSLGSVSGAVRITGLPFAQANITNGNAAVNISYADSLTLGAAGYSLGGRTEVNQTYFTIYTWDGTGGSSATQNTELQNTSQFIFTVTYFAAT